MRNLFGAIDRFAIELRPRVVLYPWRLATLFGSAPEAIPEAAARLQYSLPVPYDPRTSLFLQGQASVGLERNLDIPAEITPKTDIPMEYLAEQKVGVERRFFGSITWRSTRLRASLVAYLVPVTS